LKQKQTNLLAGITLLTIAALVAVFYFKPKMGLDVQGGARVVLEAQIDKLPAGIKWDAEKRENVRQTIENRVNANGVSETAITTKGDKQFVVEIPTQKDKGSEDQIISQLQDTAQLEFYSNTRDWESPANPNGRYRIDKLERSKSDKDKAAKDNKDNERYYVIDSTAKQEFRDTFQINEDLAKRAVRGTQAGAKAVETTLPAPLNDLKAARGHKSLPLTPEDAKDLNSLADEAKNFNAFMATSTKEMDGSDLEPNAAHGSFSSGGVDAIVELAFNAKGTDKFGAFTKAHTNEILMMYLDGRILSPSRITEPILGGRAMITGQPSIQEAKRLADYLNGGALPVPLVIQQDQRIEPTLGKEAVNQGLLAGSVGIGAIVLFMIAYYGGPGFLAVIALILYTLFNYAIFLMIPVTFTLPGIAGFILSVGMAVDANILIFERTKEELRAGKSLKPAIEAGFSRAFSAIFDSNMCSIVTSLLLYNFGTGSVKGFALTLMIGVAISMFTAITISRTFLLHVYDSNNQKGEWKIDRQLKPKFDVVGKRKLWYGLSLAVIVPLAIFASMGGMKLGIDFTGGSELTLKIPNNVERGALEKAIEKQGIKEAIAQIGSDPKAGTQLAFVRFPLQNGKPVQKEQADLVVEGLQKEFPGVQKESFETIGGAISKELTQNATQAVLYASIFIVVYLAFRFAIGGFKGGLKFGVAAIIAMLHDVLVLFGVFCGLGALLGWKIDSLFVTAALTVIGFSVHDTIIIFDRIREHLKQRGARQDFGELINESINETFARSVFTSGTVLITLLALIILGGPVIQPLNVALFVGILSGTYSSIFNAAPLVYDLRGWFTTLTKTGGIAGAGTSTGDKLGAKTEDGSGSKGDGPVYAARPKPALPSGPKRPKRRM
jgi:SecD/SecF fusion protein